MEIDSCSHFMTTPDRDNRNDFRICPAVWGVNIPPSKFHRIIPGTSTSMITIIWLLSFRMSDFVTRCLSNYQNPSEFMNAQEDFISIARPKGSWRANDRELFQVYQIALRCSAKLGDSRKHLRTKRSISLLWSCSQRDQIPARPEDFSFGFKFWSTNWRKQYAKHIWRRMTK